MQYYLQECMVLNHVFTYENYGWQERAGLYMGRIALYDVHFSDCRRLTYAVGDLLCSVVDFFPCAHEHSSNKTELCVNGYGLLCSGKPSMDVFMNYDFKYYVVFGCEFVIDLTV